MAVKDSQIKQVLIEYLRRPDRNAKRMITFRNIHNEGVLDLCRERIPGFEKADEDRLYELFYELSLERIIVPDDNTGPYQWPFYRITTHGKQVLANPADCTYDPDGYVDQLRRRVPYVSDTVVFYVQQAVTCFSHRLLPAASVMLGCAAEKLILDLVDVFVSALSNKSEQSAMQRDLDKAKHISQKYAVLWKRLVHRRSHFPYPYAECLEERLSAVFYQVRKVRNDSGHPTGYVPDEAEVHGNLILFCGYAELVYGLLEYLKGNPIP